MSETENPVRNNEAESQSEWTAGGQTAVLTYRPKTGINCVCAYRRSRKTARPGNSGKTGGRGLGICAPEGLTLIPVCPFVAGYLKKHQQYLNLVQKEYRGRVTR